MRYLRSIFVWLMPIILFSLQGCGGGNSSGAFTPFNATAQGGNQQSQQSANLKISLDVSPVAIDTVGGQVVATATVTDATTGVPAQGQPVIFTVFPTTQASVSSGMSTVLTDSNGKAISFILPNDTPTTTNVIVQASVKGVAAQSTFQIARGTGKLTFTGAPYQNQATISATAPAGTWVFSNLVTVTLTDANGNARVGAPVTLSVFSHESNLFTPGLVTVDYLVNPAGTSESTVVTDSQGKAIFNVSVDVPSPDPGGTNGDSIVFQATTNDSTPITSYGGLVVSLSRASQ